MIHKYDNMMSTTLRPSLASQLKLRVGWTQSLARWHNKRSTLRWIRIHNVPVYGRPCRRQGWELQEMRTIKKWKEAWRQPGKEAGREGSSLTWRNGSNQQKAWGRGILYHTGPYRAWGIQSIPAWNPKSWILSFQIYHASYRYGKTYIYRTRFTWGPGSVLLSYVEWRTYDITVSVILTQQRETRLKKLWQSGRLSQDYIIWLWRWGRAMESRGLNLVSGKSLAPQKWWYTRFRGTLQKTIWEGRLVGRSPTLRYRMGSVDGLDAGISPPTHK